MEPLTQDDLTCIAGNVWFSSLESNYQRRLLREAEVLNLGAGEYLTRLGDVPAGLFCAVSGMIQGSLLTEDGGETILWHIGGGDWFGETSIIDGLPRAQYFSALTPVRLLSVSRCVVEDLMQETRFLRALAVLQSSHLRLVFELLVDTRLRSTRARIARRIERLASGDSKLEVRLKREIPITQDVLALMLGITRQTLSLELRAIASTGAISLSYGRIAIESVEKLRLVAGPT